MKKSKKRQPKTRRFSRLIFWSLVFLFTILCSLFTIYWFRGWNGRDPINIVVSSGENLSILSLRPPEKQALEILIPASAVVEVPGRGKWQARALWEVAQLEKDPSLVAAVGWNLLQIPIDKVLRFSDWQSAKTSYLDNPRWFFILNFLRTSEDKDRFKQIDLADLNISRRVVDPGGAELIEINPELLSLRSEEWFGLDSLRQEGLTVAVRNNSGRPGAAALLSRQLEHVGLRVISVADGAGDSRLTVKDKNSKKSLSVRKLSSWLNAKPVIADFPERADILIVVK